MPAVSEGLKEQTAFFEMRALRDAGRWGSLVSFGLRVAVTTIQIRAGPLLPHFTATSASEESVAG